MKTQTVEREEEDTCRCDELCSNQILLVSFLVKKEVVSLGTGTKCVGQTAMSPRGVCVCVSRSCLLSPPKKDK